MKRVEIHNYHLNEEGNWAVWFDVDNGENQEAEISPDEIAERIELEGNEPPRITDADRYHEKLLRFRMHYSTLEQEEVLKQIINDKIEAI